MKILNGLIVIFTVLMTLALGSLKPAHNGDIVFYVASAYSMDGLSGVELSEETFSDVKHEVSSERFLGLTSGSNYRRAVYDDYNALEQHLPFYTIRVFYVSAMRVLGNFGLSYSEASYLVSSIFASASIVVIAFIMMHLNLPLYFMPFIAVLGGVMELSRLSAPDAMACFFSLLAISLLLRRSIFYLLIAAILPLVRTDYVILSILLVFVGYFSRFKLIALISGLTAILLYLFVNEWAGNYGWLTIFNFTMIGVDPYPADIVISGEWENYIRRYITVLWDIGNNIHGVVYFIAIVFWLQAKVNGLQDRVKVDSVTSICFLFVVLHLLAFPTYSNRFFTFAVVFLLTFILAKIRERLTQ